MNKTPFMVYRAFTMDFTAEVHYAMNDSGAVFQRTRGRGWGGRYQNSKWSLSGAAEIPADAHNTGRICRLPRTEVRA